jgi:hypothetical protein
MEITGKLIQILDPAEGEGRNGKWKRQDFIIETNEQYPRKICISNWNDKVQLDGLATGSDLTVSVNIESREYNGRWYTDVKAWKLETGGSEAQELRSSEGPGLPEPPLESFDDSGGDDLPF